MNSKDPISSIQCLYRGPDEIRFRLEMRGSKVPEELVLTPEQGFRTVDELCERHGLDLLPTLKRLADAAAEPEMVVSGGLA